MNKRQYHHCWTWNYGPDDLFHRDKATDTITRYPFKETIRQQFRFSLTGTVTKALPSQHFPAEATKYPRHYGIPFHQIFQFPTPTDNPTPISIQDMKNQLPISILRLVDKVETLVMMPEAIWCLEQQQTIRVASDGGAYPGRASFGWILQIGETKSAKGKGPAYGDDPRSFRAEGYGMASALVYLRLLQRQTNFTRTPEARNILICDNQGLLTRIEESLQWSYTTPNITLRAEWDIKLVILMMHKELNSEISFMHVKSHQDDDAPQRVYRSKHILTTRQIILQQNT